MAYHDVRVPERRPAPGLSSMYVVPVPRGPRRGWWVSGVAVIVAFVTLLAAVWGGWWWWNDFRIAHRRGADLVWQTRTLFACDHRQVQTAIDHSKNADSIDMLAGDGRFFDYGIKQFTVTRRGYDVTLDAPTHEGRQLGIVAWITKAENNQVDETVEEDEFMTAVVIRKDSVTIEDSNAVRSLRNLDLTETEAKRLAVDAVRLLLDTVYDNWGR